MMKQQKGFTLAETLITLTILGVVAAITVPSLINKYSESANRTKVKKSMAAYEKALNQMIIENDLKGSVGAVKAWADTEADCALTTVYFKKILGSGCIFQTADKVWWDIKDIEHPVISLKDEITAAKRDDFKNAAKSSDNNDVFGLVGYIDDGVVRINDKGAATAGTDDATLLNKTYAFINNESNNNDNNPCNIWKTKLLNATKNVCTTEPYKNCITDDGTLEYAADGSIIGGYSGTKIYDEDGNLIADSGGSYISITKDGDVDSLALGGAIYDGGTLIFQCIGYCYKESSGITQTQSYINTKIYNDDWTEVICDCALCDLDTGECSENGCKKVGDTWTGCK